MIQEVQNLEHQGFQFEAADGSLYLLMNKIKGLNPSYFDFESFRVYSERRNSENVVSEAVCKVIVKEERYVTTGEGVGPVDALSKALISMVILSLGKGQDSPTILRKGTACFNATDSFGFSLFFTRYT